MKVGICSDLHLDFSPLPSSFFDVDCDVLVIAGDTHELRRLKSESMVLFWQQASRSARHVLVVAGNHEFYGGSYPHELNKFRDFLASDYSYGNITLLENENVVIDGVNFIGACLWTDLNKHNPITMIDVHRGMNDYREIRMSGHEYRKLQPQDTVRMHEQSKKFIFNTASRSKHPCFVITHHAPSEQSLSYYAGFDLNPAYASNLDCNILNTPTIQTWVHGHTHRPVDYMIEQCRVICNPRGYTHEAVAGYSLLVINI